MRWLLTLVLSILIVQSGLPLAAAQNESPAFGFEHAETGLTHIELTLAPGESEEITLRHFTRNGDPAEVTVFPSNVYTVRGGGMGVNDIDHPRSGATTWLDLRTTDLTLEPDEPVEQSVTVSVPEDASPGEYLTAIVSMSATDDNGDQADRPRQVLPVHIDVPGDRDPEMELDGVEHRVVDGQSVVDVRLVNSGNVHLRPSGSFALRSIGGDTLADTAIGLGTVYAGTSTRIEVTFTNELPAGEYLIALELRDDITVARIEADDLSVIVAGAEPTPEATAVETAVPDQTDDSDNGGIIGSIRTPDVSSGNMPGSQALVLGGLAIVFIIVLVATLIIRIGHSEAAPAEHATYTEPHVQAPFHRKPSVHHQSRPRQIRQLVPPGRTS